MSTFKKIAAIGVLSLALALTLTTVVGADTMTFNSNLTIGSTGADVVALQTLLVSKGFLTMPAGVSMGYFGTLTKNAVKAWQASVGVPATGYFGPLSRAAANTAGVAVGTPGCPAGAAFNSQTGAPCTTTVTTIPGCTAGALFSSTTGQSCTTTTTPTTTGGPFVMDGTDGSVTLSYVSYAPASQTLKKGDMNKPVISVQLQAVNGSVDVTRFDVHFSERPWLDFGSLTLTDSSGNVIATKTLSGASDVTEVTVGTDYLVRFDNMNVVVAPGTPKILAVAVNVLAASDKITGQTVYVGIPAGSIRTLNGKGYTDSVGLSSGQGSAATQASGNAVTLSSTGSSASIYTRIDPSSSATNRSVVTSASQSTPSVVLGVFSLEAQNQNATVNSLSFNINSSTGVATTTLYSNLRLQAGGNTYGSNNPVAGNTTFTNMNIALPVNQWVPITLLADVNTNQTGVSASSTLVASSIVGVDANYNTLTLTSASNQTSTDNVYSISGINVTPGAVSVSACTGGNQNYQNSTCAMTMTFTVQNAGNTDIFISKTPSIALSTTTLVNGTASAVASSTLSTINIASGPGDTTASYDVPASGTRTFTYQGQISKSAAGGAQTFQITAVKFGTVSTNGAPDATLNAQTLTASSNTASEVNYGLQSLYGYVPFGTLP